MMKQICKRVLLSFAAMLFVVSAFAQVTTSTLNGKVSDNQGEPIAGATVVAVHTPSGTQYYAVANAEGRFYINGMRAGGPYSVEVSCLGYNSVTYTDITLQLAEAYALNASLSDDTEMLSEAIIISEAASKFATEKTGAATNVNSRQITALPTVSRNLTDVTRLSPYGGNGMTFMGADNRSSNFTIDGANFNNNFGLSGDLPGGGNPVSLDAIEEMQIVISPYDVRQANFIGGGVNAITKSGTNTFKGSAYIYHRNEFLRGNTVAGLELGDRERERTTTYGMTLGGPIIKNKLFFFVNFEYIPHPEETSRWRPSTDGIANPALAISRTTVADMQKVKKFVMDKYGYDTGSYDSFLGNEMNMKALARIDWNINDRHKLALRYNYTISKENNPTNASSSDCRQRTTEGRISQYSMSFANSFYSMNNLVHSFSLDLNSRLSDNMVNQLLVTYSKLDTTRGTDSAYFPFIDILDGTGTITPYMSLGYELFTWQNGYHNDVIIAKDDFTMFMGDHKLTAGLGYEYQMADNAYLRNGTGYYRYHSLDDFLTGATPETVNFTYGYENLMRDNPASRVTYHKASLYAQDEWNVNDKLKLTAGLRLDSYIFDNSNIITNNAVYNLEYPDSEGNIRHIDTGRWPGAAPSISPRIGFTWDVLGDKSLKLRGGTGLFVGRVPLVFFTNMPSNSSMNQYAGIISTSYKDGVGTPDPLLEQFKGGLIVDREAMRQKFYDLGFPKEISSEDGRIPSKLAAVDPNFKMPQVWKTSLAVDYAFPTSFPFSVTVEGMFNQNVNASTMEDWNMIPVNGFARFNGADNRPIYPANYRYTSSPAYVLTNTHLGYSYSGSISLNMSPVEGLDIFAAYTHVENKELTSLPGSDPASIFNYVPTVAGPNYTQLHSAQNNTPDRFVASLTHNDRSGNHFSFIYEAWRGGYNYSYMLTNDMNGDNYKYDSLFIPTDEQVANGDFRFVSNDDAARFMDFVHNDSYLSKHQGEYAEGYSVYSPWVHRVDFSYKHDFTVKIGSTTNTLQFSLDIKNLLNMFDSSWGVAKYMNPDLNSGRILQYEGVDAQGYATFSTPAVVSGNTQTWGYNSSIGQCWYAQVGLKYFFN
ncbi:MAG: TonB-dependent receptor [Bacteroidales bacterium]|nr:TonB-dependent receptor [Bacteroidales bacterium]